MRILLVTQHFYPEPFDLNDLVKCLVSQEHEVEVLTGKPNYPDGIIFPGYKARGQTSEYFNGSVLVHRVPIFPRGRGVKRLLMNYISFVVSGLFYFRRLVKKKKFDIIFSFAPITTVIPAIYLSKRFKTHLAIWVQDLWPETLMATGYINNRFILLGVKHLVRWIYTSSDTILVPSNAFCEPISKYASKNKIVYFPNSYLSPSSNLKNKNQIPSHLLIELEQNHCIVCAGNFGTAQAMETIIQTAGYLRSLKNFKLILVGSGCMSGWLEQQLIEKALDNVILAGRFPASLMPAIFSLAKGLLVTLKKDEAFTYIIPSRIQAYLAAGRPIIAGLDGEGARIIEEAGAGFTSPAEDPVALANNIERLYYMSLDKREELGRSARLYFLEHFEMNQQSKRLIDIFKNRINEFSETSTSI